MLKDAEVSAMVPVKDLEKAKKFYSDTLELDTSEENPAGVLYKCAGTKLFVYQTPAAGTAKSTAATWEVANITRVVEWLKGKGCKFEYYDYPGTKHEGDVHVWGEARSAWFCDPDGNILGLSQA